jgi:GntR family transcriptional repressor for pyruvate dehydrogenase complex
MEFKPIRPKRLYQDIVEQIRGLMAGGELKPGDRLLPERDLAEQLHVSRVSVREAIRALEMMGVVEIRPGEGTFVRDRDSDQIIRPLAMFLAVERSSLLEMFEVRRIFETATASLAAERASDEEVADVLAALESMAEKINVRDSEKGEEFDITFHYAIAEATHNPLLIKLFRTLQEEFGRAVSAARRQLYLGEDNPQKILDQHRKIYRAIKAHDPAKAADCMLAHLTYAERELRKRLG